MKAPVVWTLEGFFKGRPEALRLFYFIQIFIETLGPVKMEVAKTQISFGVKRKFVWVWLPQMWVKRPEGSITLTFDLSHRVDHQMIEQAVEPRPGRWTHHVIIKREPDLDEDVRGWLREAYESGKVNKRRAKSTGVVKLQSG